MILYLRYEPALDGDPRPDVVAFMPRPDGEPDMSQPVARWPAHLPERPKRRTRHVMYNCAQYRAVWLDHMGRPG